MTLKRTEELKPLHRHQDFRTCHWATLRVFPLLSRVLLVSEALIRRAYGAALRKLCAVSKGVLEPPCSDSVLGRKSTHRMELSRANCKSSTICSQVLVTQVPNGDLVYSNIKTWISAELGMERIQAFWVSSAAH